MSTDVLQGHPPLEIDRQLAVELVADLGPPTAAISLARTPGLFSLAGGFLGGAKAVLGEMAQRGAEYACLRTELAGAAGIIVGGAPNRLLRQGAGNGGAG